MNLTKIKPYLIYQFSSESELMQEIEKLSHGFNMQRDDLTGYVLNQKSVAAYTCFYALTNIAKLETSLQRVGISNLDDYELVDIGAGPGTFTLAALALNPSQDCVLVEQSDMMREQASKLIEGLYPDASVRIFDSRKRVADKKKKRLGLFGHSANEMTLELVKKFISDLDLDEVLFIEPGTKTFFAQMKSIRSWLVDSGFEINYPCSGKTDCPVSGDDWCHQYLNIRHDQEVERLCQLVKKDRRLVPIILHHYKKDEAEKRQKYVIQRMLPALKFAQPMVVCTQNANNSLQLMRLEVLFKGLSKSEKKTLQKSLAGDTIDIDLVKQLENGDWRANWKPKTSPENIF